jgi:hypothetical protein
MTKKQHENYALLVEVAVSFTIMAALFIAGGSLQQQALGQDPASTTTPTNTTGLIGNQSTSTPKALSISIEVEKNPISRGSEQTINIMVTNANSTGVKGATVDTVVQYAGPTTREFTGTTDDSGKHSITWRIGGASTPGTFQVTSTASATGYNEETARTTFEVQPANRS